MNKIIGWILSLTKIGKAIEPVQKFIGGYKTYIAGLGIAIPALLVMINNFGDQGAAYLTTVSTSPEWLAFMNGLGLMGLRAAVSKQGAPTVPTTTP